MKKRKPEAPTVALNRLLGAPAAWWKQKNLRPSHRILWALIWIGPAYLTRALFVAVMFCGWGPGAAGRAWSGTK